MQNRSQPEGTQVSPVRPFTAILLADAPAALVELCGISLLERNLRVLQRLAAGSAHVITSTPEPIQTHLGAPSWARATLTVAVHASDAARLTLREIARVETEQERILLLNAAAYYDARLLRTLAEQSRTAVLVDSAPCALMARLLDGRAGGPDCALITREWLSAADPMAAVFDSLRAATLDGRVLTLDAAKVPSYLADMRREIRPLWFPAPRPELRPLAEAALLDAAQNGTLDLPAIAHGPIETAIVRRLCRTRITPMQITLFTAAVSGIVTGLFASGHLLLGTWLALIVGVLDGVDGKQARVKVETTELGKREHVLDYVLELSWWMALAYHFASTGSLENAYAFALLLVVSDLVDRYAKRIAKQHTGRNLDDVAPIDRCVRLIGGRRNIYVWILALGLTVDAADKSFALVCWWGAATAAFHVLRAVGIVRQWRNA